MRGDIFGVRPPRWREATTVLQFRDMSDRTEALLAELVELQRRQLANQEEALAGQRRSIDAQASSVELQRLAVERQRKALRIVFTLIAIVVFLMFVPTLFLWFYRR